MRLSAPPTPLATMPRALAAVGGGLLLAARFLPFERYPILACPLRTFAHIPCPSCGMTRAFVRVAHGELGRALEVSPLGTLLALGAVVAVGWLLLRLTVLRRGLVVELSKRESFAARLGIVATILGNWTYLLVTRAAG